MAVRASSAAAGGEWIDRVFVDEEAEHLGDDVAARLLPHHHAGANVEHELEQLGPERAAAEFRHHGEIEADVADGAAERAAADLTLTLLNGRLTR